eukprot:948237-Prymnesium_polylepis.1
MHAAGSVRSGAPGGGVPTRAAHVVFGLAWQSHQVLDIIVSERLVQDLGGEGLLGVDMHDLLHLGEVALADCPHVRKDVPELPV